MCRQKGPLRIELQQTNQCNQVSEVGFKTCANSERIQNMLVFTAISSVCDPDTPISHDWLKNLRISDADPILSPNSGLLLYSEFKVWLHVQIHSKRLLAARCTADSAVMSSHFVLKSPVD